MKIFDSFLLFLSPFMPLNSAWCKPEMYLVNFQAFPCTSFSLCLLFVSFNYFESYKGKKTSPRVSTSFLHVQLRHLSTVSDSNKVYCAVLVTLEYSLVVVTHMSYYPKTADHNGSLV